MSDSILLVRDVLDQPIVGPDEHPCGTVDGTVLVLADDGTLRVAAIEEGAATLARRISKTLGRMLERFPVVGGPVVRRRRLCLPPRPIEHQQEPVMEDVGEAREGGVPLVALAIPDELGQVQR